MPQQPRASTIRDYKAGQIAPREAAPGITKRSMRLHRAPSYRCRARRRARSAATLSRFVALLSETWRAIAIDPKRIIIKRALTVSLVIAEPPDAPLFEVERNSSGVLLLWINKLTIDALKAREPCSAEAGRLLDIDQSRTSEAVAKREPMKPLGRTRCSCTCRL
ncbi:MULTISPECIES: hypothetical protein [Bradyrhizobium]|uniref:hypothetical protein n=1 Tax=Bradyrhizobium TaxID=374 RepID=UPI0012FEC6CE|nr:MULTISPECIES: hypothetical protein [Bradyrhizobium]